MKDYAVPEDKCYVCNSAKNKEEMLVCSECCVNVCHLLCDRLVKKPKNVNEWITFFRHYIGGYLICTAQSTDDVVVQIRRKLNQAVWCYDFHKWFFGLFYTIRMCDIMLSDQVSTISTTQLEENTKRHFGLFPKKGTYATRCYKPRYENILYKKEEQKQFDNIYTTKVLRLMRYVSPLDDTTTKEQKQEQYEKGQKIWKN